MHSIQQASQERNTPVLPPQVEVRTVDTGVMGVRRRIRGRKWAETILNPEASPRDKRLAMLAYLRVYLPHGYITRFCMIGPRGDRDHVDLKYSDEKKKARYDGAHKCGSVWVCPVCVETITGKRRDELKLLLASTKYTVCMVTFTLQHGREDELQAQVNGLKKALRSMKSSRAWRRFAKKWGIIGQVGALEPTNGSQNGWHSHQHEMIVFDPERLPLSPIERKRALQTTFQAELFSMWSKALARQGMTCDEEHGVKVSANRREYGSYIAKWGVSEELSRSVNKQASGGNKSVWKLLEEATCGDERSWRLFLEYAKAFKGKKQLHWSRGLRSLLELPEEEKSDGELVEEAPDPGQAERVAVSFSRLAWQYMIFHDLLGALLNYCERVQADPDELQAFLARMGLREGVYFCLPLGIYSRFASAPSPGGSSPPGREPGGG